MRAMRAVRDTRASAKLQVRALILAQVLALVLASAATGCGSSRNLPPSTGEPPLTGQDASGDDGAIDASGPPVDSGSSNPGDDGADADVDATADAGEGEAEAGPVFPPACSPSNTWSTIARVASIAPAGFDRFGAISADALVVAWTTTAGAIYVADRASTAASFGTPALLGPGSLALANGRVALAPTGLELIATLADGSSFVSFFRTSAGGTWSPTNSKEFATVATMRGESGGAFSEPVVSADGSSLFYLLALPNQAPVLYESPWDPQLREWATGAALSSPEFAIASAMQVRRATGASSDRRTLFFFDEVAGTERAAWRESPSAPFAMFADLANLPEAAPVDDCTVLYFHGSDGAGQGLFTGTGP